MRWRSGLGAGMVVDSGWLRCWRVHARCPESAAAQLSRFKGMESAVTVTSAGRGVRAGLCARPSRRTGWIAHLGTAVAFLLVEGRGEGVWSVGRGRGGGMQEMAKVWGACGCAEALLEGKRRGQARRGSKPGEGRGGAKGQGGRQGGHGEPVSGARSFATRAREPGVAGAGGDVGVGGLPGRRSGAAESWLGPGAW